MNGNSRLTLTSVLMVACLGIAFLAGQFSVQNKGREKSPDPEIEVLVLNEPVVPEPGSSAQAPPVVMRADFPVPKPPPAHPDSLERDDPKIPVARVALWDAEGLSMGHCLVPLVRTSADTRVLLIPQLSLLGAVKGAARLGDSTVLLGRVKGRSGARGLATVALELPENDGAAQVPRPATSQPSTGEQVWLISTQDTGRRRPVRVLGGRWDVISGVETLELEKGSTVELDSGGVLIDSAGFVCGVAPPGWSSERKDYAIPVTVELMTRMSPLDMDVRTYTQTFYEGSAEAHFRRGLKQLERGRFEDSIASLKRAVDVDSSYQDRIQEPLHGAWTAWLDSIEGRASIDERLGLLKSALADFPDDLDFLVGFAELSLDGFYFRDVLVAWDRIWVLNPGKVGDLLARKANVYMIWVNWCIERGATGDALAVLEEALAILSDPQLWRQYGDLLVRERAYLEAATAYEEAVRADPGLEGLLKGRIERARRFAAGPGKVVIDYTPGSRTILAEVSVNGRARGTFIIDTGATSSWVPANLAKSAGLDTGPNVPRVRVKTAGNERVLPYSPANLLSVGSLGVRNLNVVVGDLPGTANRGLLGMDFLGSFTFENDSSNGRFVIYEK